MKLEKNEVYEFGNIVLIPEENLNEEKIIRVCLRFPSKSGEFANYQRPFVDKSIYSNMVEITEVPQQQEKTQSFLRKALLFFKIAIPFFVLFIQSSIWSILQPNFFPFASEPLSFSSLTLQSLIFGSLIFVLWLGVELFFKLIGLKDKEYNLLLIHYFKGRKRSKEQLQKAEGRLAEAFKKHNIQP